jgi:citrate synthase
MGFGHRVYKAGDPRARILKPLAAKLATSPEQAALEQTAAAIEKVLIEEKNLHPNVDWPAARVYHYLGLVPDVFTPLFAMARLVGWSAHVIEQQDHNRIIRPLANYVGAALRQWQPMSERG